jgi:hypothetical protein
MTTKISYVLIILWVCHCCQSVDTGFHVITSILVIFKKVIFKFNSFGKSLAERVQKVEISKIWTFFFFHLILMYFCVQDYHLYGP